MCITIDPSSVENTTYIYTGDTKIDDQVHHVLGYQNCIKNISSGPNAMVLPFPSDIEMGPESVIHTDKKDSSFLETLGKVFNDYDGFYLNNSRGITKGAGPASASFIKTFEAGSYSVVLTKSVSVEGIQAALQSVPENKRPKFTDHFIDGFNQLYPDWQIAICCFNGEIKSENMFWKYVPRDVNSFFAPTLDSHHARLPYVDQYPDYISYNHKILAGSTLAKIISSGDEYQPSNIEIPNSLKEYVGNVDSIQCFNLNHHKNTDTWISRVELNGMRRYSMNSLPPPGFVGKALDSERIKKLNEQDEIERKKSEIKERMKEQKEREERDKYYASFVKGFDKVDPSKGFFRRSPVIIPKHLPFDEEIKMVLNESKAEVVDFGKKTIIGKQG